MATVLFAAAGAALGAGFGGTVLGLSGAVIGRAVGASVGRVIDQRLMGLGSEAVEVGRVDRLRVMGASEGGPIARCWGRVRLPGQVIWASPFKEVSSRSGGGKGMPRPRTVQYSYTVSLAIALCEGAILGVGRVWADGAEINPASLDMRVYHGTRDQMPDPVLEAELGAGLAPAYRDTAYVVLENLDLSVFGNRVPQLSFEVIRQANVEDAPDIVGYDDMIRAVSVIPGTGEYSLATEKVKVAQGFLTGKPINVNTRADVANFRASLDQLERELPNCDALSLIVSWFGNDLRCGHCEVRPAVEQTQVDSTNMPWSAGGIGRSQAEVVPKQQGRSVYGGTPADGAVIQAIQAANSVGRAVMFYPFILMTQLEGNTLPDPYTGSPGQSVLPWRGRITLSIAPGKEGTPDQTPAVLSEVANFFGSASPTDFSIASGAVVYTGPVQWGYRRFILHYAYLCRLAGGVEAFCIGSELRGLTQIRGAGHSFPVVAELKSLASQVREILGEGTKISYAADWSEYFGYHQDGNVYFHLDPLWADQNIDFVGIDNYMPMSDWRDQPGHADEQWKAIGNLEYLKSNICGGEGFDWYYDGEERRDSQLRSSIEDGAYDEPWIYRPKDLRSWWGNLHFNRINGQRLDQSTEWIPEAKPIWFTEYGCAAVDKGTNQPNKFLDPKSSESALPNYSSGNRDDYIQFQYYRAMHEYWNVRTNNPESKIYSGAMLNTERMFAWAWDARPYPEFPRNEDLWSDGPNYLRGHWLNGRVSSVSLDGVVQEVVGNVSADRIRSSDLHGLVSGYISDDLGSARAILQPLGMAFAFDAVESDGRLHFVSRGISAAINIDSDSEALGSDLERTLETIRLADAETIGRSRLVYLSSNGDFQINAAEFAFSDDRATTVAQSEFSLSLTSAEAKFTVERWLAEARTARDVLKLRLPPSMSEVRAGSVIEINGVFFRVDRVELDEARIVEAVRIEKSHYVNRDSQAEVTKWISYEPPSPMLPVWMDLPLLRGSEVPHAPHIAMTGNVWPGTVAVWDSDQDDGYALLNTIESQSIVGRTLSPLFAARPGLVDGGAPLRVELSNGELSSAQWTSVLNGENLVAIGDGSSANWEIFQFQSALLVGDKTFELSHRLRGQLGSEALMPLMWPTGSTLVVLDQSITQIALKPSLRGVQRYYRVGAAAKGYADENTSSHVLQFSGNGLRPLSVCHLQAVLESNGDYQFSWVRRTRIDGDSWESLEVPLGEEELRFLVTIRNVEGELLRSETVTESRYLYTYLIRSLDMLSGSFVIEVSQISSSFGVGPSRRLIV